MEVKTLTIRKTTTNPQDIKTESYIWQLGVFLRSFKDRIIFNDYDSKDGMKTNLKEETLIEIYEDGKVIFKGDKNKLFEILKRNKS
jgi:hypothetical protein